MPDESRIAACAARLFHERGITATGVHALAKAAGISKRTLYQQFASKDELVAAAYATLDMPVFERFTKPAESAATPRAQLDRLFGELERAVGSPHFRGCPFANASAELADPAHPAHAVVKRHKERLRKWIYERVCATGAADPALVSRQLLLAFDGAQARALAERSARPARDARKLARALLDAAAR